MRLARDMRVSSSKSPNNDNYNCSQHPESNNEEAMFSAATPDNSRPNMYSSVQNNTMSNVPTCKSASAPGLSLGMQGAHRRQDQIKAAANEAATAAAAQKTDTNAGKKVAGVKRVAEANRGKGGKGGRGRKSTNQKGRKKSNNSRSCSRHPDNDNEEAMFSPVTRENSRPYSSVQNNTMFNVPTCKLASAPGQSLAMDGAPQGLGVQSSPSPSAALPGTTLVSREGTVKASDVAASEAVAVATSCDILAEAKKELVAAGAIEDPAANEATKVGTDDARVVL